MAFSQATGQGKYLLPTSEGPKGASPPSPPTHLMSGGDSVRFPEPSWSWVVLTTY